jgi:hypothetical protein
VGELAIVQSYLDTTLKQDATLKTLAPGGVWRDIAPAGTKTPYVVFTMVAGSDALTGNVARIMTQVYMQVKGVGPTSNYVALISVADRIDTLLKRTGPVTVGSLGGVVACWREQLIAYGEVNESVMWSHLGGLYHLQVKV